MIGVLLPESQGSGKIEKTVKELEGRRVK